ncbi:MULTISPECIES: hypothetical protein [Marinobacter]|uniref:hypothetical protein n=1 Tax=Marinobacter TaxID=2742 RepID=UPI0012482361|nr:MULTISPECIES: hypothetical protein [Marinobacter]MBL3558557.1 hypothetical protein [Marinobacter sp. JB05H06]
MDKIRLIAATSALALISGCSVIGGGSGTQYSEFAGGSCDIEVHNEGSFFTGHQIVGLTGQRVVHEKNIDRMATYLIAEGYDIRDSGASDLLTGVYYSNGKQYQMSVRVEDHPSGGNRLQLSFSTPPLIGLLTADVRDEFCTIEATAKFTPKAG